MKVTTSKHPVYPQPPFKKQDQPVPGVSRKMDPVPDHGEKSYIGNNPVDWTSFSYQWGRLRSWQGCGYSDGGGRC